MDINLLEKIISALSGPTGAPDLDDVRTTAGEMLRHYSAVYARKWPIGSRRKVGVTKSKEQLMQRAFLFI